MRRNDPRLMLLRQLSALRRQACEGSLRCFAQTYLAQHFAVAPSRMHLEITALLEEAAGRKADPGGDFAGKRGLKLAVAAPRNHAKTTLVSLAYVLWCVLYRKERLILLISATREQAVQLLKDIRGELTGNPLLLSDFPELCAADLGSAAGARRSRLKWTENHINLANGCAVRGLGSGQGLRGMKNAQHRPSLIICDDLEELEPARKQEQRDKLRDWFQKTLLMAGDSYTNFVVVGTILDHEALLARLTSEKKTGGRGSGWQGRLYRAVERFSDHDTLWQQWKAIRYGEQEFEGLDGIEGSKLFYERNQEKMLAGTAVLWPEHESYLRLMEIEADEGRVTFEMEKQNQPLDPALCTFRRENIHYWDDPAKPIATDVPSLLRHLGEYRIVGACDPSLGRHPGRGDYTAIVLVATHTDHKHQPYVIEAFLDRISPDAAINKMVELCKIYKIREFRVEGNQFQELMVKQFKQRISAEDLTTTVKSVRNDTNKNSRIKALDTLVPSGSLKFSRRHTLLLEQLFAFPLGAHDDGPDALEMAVSAAQNYSYFNVIQA